ncbi:TlyA family RNA methyltransferase [Agaribacterium haliotis]|uniref:TlyA family RNA methyltransferase n=1 Tax=Agaribacterium haliotis TaxID=2013869 RepID=UPI000BB59274|nr:TlyA family RNA methyltransferase [Agaribacterium haliotis]
MASERIDKLLVELGLCSSRTLAQRLIDAGKVEFGRGGVWQQVAKANAKFDRSLQFRILQAEELRYVSRAGLKLEGAIETLAELGLKPNWAELSAIDVGQSTGGFSDCLLKHGCASVCGVDVGKNQLAASLRGDRRLRCMEGVNARELGQYFPSERFDLAVMDVSFISQTLILPELVGVLKNNAVLISLVKPQFEVGPEGIAKGGLVKNEDLYAQVALKIRTLLGQLGLELLSWKESKIRGGDGNREFIAIATR